MKPSSYGQQFVPPQKRFMILNGKDLYIRNFDDSSDAILWAQNHCDCSLEIIVREISREILI